LSTLVKLEKDYSTPLDCQGWSNPQRGRVDKLIELNGKAIPTPPRVNSTDESQDGSGDSEENDRTAGAAAEWHGWGLQPVESRHVSP